MGGTAKAIMWWRFFPTLTTAQYLLNINHVLQKGKREERRRGEGREERRGEREEEEEERGNQLM